MGVIVLEEMVEVVVVIFTMLGGEEFVTGSALILVRTSALHFLLFFFLDFLQYQLQLLIFPHFLLLSLGLATTFFSILLTLSSTSTPATTVEEVLACGSREDSTTLLE